MSTATLIRPELIWHQGSFREGWALELSGGQIRSVRPATAEDGPSLRRRALLPGLVNAHSHAFQRLIRGRTEFVAEGHASDDFWTWRELMYQAASALEPGDVFLASRQAFLEMVLAGITTVGEFHYLHHQADGVPYADRLELAEQVVAAAQAVGLRICLLRVGYARAGFQVAPNSRQRRFIDGGPEAFLSDAVALAQRHRSDPMVSVGLAPHSVRAVPREWLEAVRDRPEPLHMHVSEQLAENRACLAEHGVTPVQLLERLGLLTDRFTAVHAIHLEDADVAALGRARANVCACPSTERNLGDGVVPADRLAAARVSLNLGSDSQANIDLLDEARQLESHLRLIRLRRAVLDPGAGTRDGLGARLFEMASVQGARSLGLPVGALEPGQGADWFTIDLDHPSIAGASADALMAAVVFGMDKGAIDEVVVNGRTLVRGGRHALAAESSEQFSALARRIFS